MEARSQPFARGGATVPTSVASRGRWKLDERYLGSGFVFLVGLTLFLLSALDKDVRRKRFRDLGYVDTQGIYGGGGLMLMSLIALIALLTGAID